MYIPNEIKDLIKSYLFKCEKCLVYTVGPPRRCALCFPGLRICSDCFFVSGLTHLSCFTCGKCSMCACFDRLTHGWYVDYYGNNLQYGSPDEGTVLPPQPANINDFINSALQVVYPQPPNENNN